MRNPFRYFKTSPEVIRLAVMMYVRFPLSLRLVEDQHCHLWTPPSLQAAYVIQGDNNVIFFLSSEGNSSRAQVPITPSARPILAKAASARSI